MHEKARSTLSQLLRQVELLADLVDETELGLDPVRVLLLVHEDALEELFARVVAELAAEAETLVEALDRAVFQVEIALELLRHGLADVERVEALEQDNRTHKWTRDELREYFKAAKDGLAERGVLMLDLFGGYESIEDNKEETTEHDGFDYIWEQHKYDPINAFGTYKIHFRFPDGSQMKNAFVYEWRLWTIPEVREVLIEAGFDKVKIFWEGTDPDSGEGTGRYLEATQGDCDPAWTCYIAGIKGS